MKTDAYTCDRCGAEMKYRPITVGPIYVSVPLRQGSGLNLWMHHVTCNPDGPSVHLCNPCVGIVLALALTESDKRIRGVK